jgi:hypothetical protein
MAKDIYHDIVKEALIKDGWTITHDPFTILPKAEGGLETDLGAEKLIAASKGLKKIAVEVKSFVRPSILHDFHGAIGQYLFYIPALEMKKEEDRTMFLAIPDYIYYKLVQKEVVNRAIEKYDIKIVIFDAETSTIISWKE